MISETWYKVRAPAYFAAGAVVAIDQLTKWLVLSALDEPPFGMVVLPMFNLVLVHNKGISFGMFNQESELGAWVLIALAAAIVIGLLVWMRQLRSPWPITAIGLVIGGAVGNSIDRLRIGAVVDFLDFHVLDYHWPAFNAADTAIVIGVGMLLIDGLFQRKELVQ